VLAQRERDVLEHVHVREQRAVLKQHPHSLAQREHLASVERREILTTHDDPPAGRRSLGGDQLQQRGLAGAARAHDPGNTASAYREVEAAQNHAGGDLIVDAAHVDDDVGAARSL
jgi:hypothetical protein